MQPFSVSKLTSQLEIVEVYPKERMEPKRVLLGDIKEIVVVEPIYSIQEVTHMWGKF